MIDQEQIEKLLVEWEDSRENGVMLTVEELCHDCPEYILQLRPQIAALEEIYGRLFPETLAPEETLPSGTDASFVSPPGYELLSRLGSGGMGVVYKARQVALDRIVAIKIIRDSRFASPKQIARFQIEAAALAEIEHPNIVNVYDVGSFENRPFLVFEYVNAGNLAERIQRKPQPVNVAASFVRDLAEAVQAAHDRGIVHRDLKPANILLHDKSDFATIELENLIPKITDFGIAKRIDAKRDLTISGEIIGSPDYMSPEQAAGDIERIGPSTDVYSLGVILFELLTGRKPFEATSQVEKLNAIQLQEASNPSTFRKEISKDLDTICLRCLQKKPGERYASAYELSNDLTRFLNGQPIQARAIGTAEKLIRWCQRNPVVSSLSALLVAAIIVGVSGIVWNWREAVLAKEQSDRDLVRARAAVDQYLVSISEETLLEEPGFQGLRQELLQSAADYYRQMIDDHGGDESLDNELALAHSRLGRIALVTGPSETARKHLEMAANLLDQIENDAGSFNEIETAVQHDLGVLEYRQGNLEGALEHLNRALACCDNENPMLKSDEIAQLAFANSLLVRGAIYSNIGKADNARSDLEKAITIGDHWTDVAEQQVKFLNLTASAYNTHGLIEKQLGRYSMAINDFRKAKSILESLTEKESNISKYRQSLNRVVNNLGNAYYESNRLDKAFETLAEGTRISEELVRTNPAVISYKISLADNFNNLGNLYRSEKKLAKALDCYRSSRNQRLKILDLDSSLMDVRNDLANSVNNIGTIYGERGQPHKASEFYKEAIEQSELIRKFSTEIVENEIRLATSSKNLASNLQEIGDLENAALAAADAIEKSIENSEKFAGNVHVLVDLASAHRVLGHILAEQGAFQSALHHYESSQQTWQLVSKEARQLASNRSRIAGLHFDWGKCLQDSANIKSAKLRYEQANKTLDEILTEFPNDIDAQKQRSICLFRLATLNRVLGKTDIAIEQLQTALSISVKLMQEFPDNSQFVFLNAFNQLGLANCRQITGETEQGIDICKEVIEQVEGVSNEELAPLESIQILSMAQMTLGEMLTHQRKYSQAAPSFEQALGGFNDLMASSPLSTKYKIGFVVTASNYGACLRKAKSFKRAYETYTDGIAVAKNILANNKDHAQAKIMVANLSWGRARIANFLSQFEEAASDWQQAINHSAKRNHRLFRMERAWSLNQAGQPEEAVKESERMLADEPQNGELNFISARHYGQALVALDRLDEKLDESAKETLRKQFADRCYELIQLASDYGYFQDESKINQLIRLGDFSSLRKLDSFESFYESMSE